MPKSRSMAMSPVNRLITADFLSEEGLKYGGGASRAGAFKIAFR